MNSLYYTNGTCSDIYAYYYNKYIDAENTYKSKKTFANLTNYNKQYDNLCNYTTNPTKCQGDTTKSFKFPPCTSKNTTPG